jgi:phospholipase/carboxylesterase
MSSLIYRERPADGAPEGLLVLHHGRGADENDLLDMADVLDPQRRLYVITPGGPLTVPGWPGKHWYVVPRVGHPDQETFAAAYGKLADFHDELWRRTEIGPERTVLGDELLDGSRSRPAVGRRRSRLCRVHPDRRGLGARPGRA